MENVGQKEPATADVWIFVEDVNEFQPMFTEPTYVAAVDETTAVGSIVVNISVKDQDVESAVEFSIISDDDVARHYFDIDRFTGTIRTSRLLSDLRENKIEFFVQASDNGSPPRHSNAKIVIYLNRTTKMTSSTALPATSTITVSEERVAPSDHMTVSKHFVQKSLALPIVFSTRLFRTEVQEVIPAPQHVLLLTMANKAPNQVVHCAISSGNYEGAFALRINENGLCMLETQIDLDRELIPNYRLNITAYVSTYAGLEFVDTTSVEIDVLDANDHPPVFQFDQGEPDGMTYFAVATAGTKPLTPMLRVTVKESIECQPTRTGNSNYFIIELSILIYYYFNALKN
ncbi:unnamed protein product [Soboliphyme baturini]|uniref:Cadherin domain-containing protein n=1 Tax=Soboliphyme baturini TaxID=241478 RepID=A0A183J601_9BILA|nr:unnamed protein product [Soboliphyme baturini]